MTPRRASQRFGERAELLDFLLKCRGSLLKHWTWRRAFRHRLHRQRSGSYDVFAILLYNDRTKALTFGTPSDIVKKLLRSLSIPLGEGIVGIAAERREPVLVEDVTRDRAI